MKSKLKNIFLVLVTFAFTQIATSAIACSCIGKDKQNTENELKFVDIAFKGKVIGVSNYEYYDTAAYTINSGKFDPKQAGYLIRKYKIFTFVIDKEYKAPKDLVDTIKIVTGYGNGDCGYEFEVGKGYIVYGESWKEKRISARQRKRKVKRRIIDTVIANKFYTDICRLTQEANAKELDNLKRLTE